REFPGPARADVGAAMGGNAAGGIGDQPTAYDVVLIRHRFTWLGGVEDMEQLCRRLATDERAEGNPHGGLAVRARGWLAPAISLGCSREVSIVDHLDGRPRQRKGHIDLANTQHYLCGTHSGSRGAAHMNRRENRIPGCASCLVGVESVKGKWV